MEREEARAWFPDEQSEARHAVLRAVAVVGLVAAIACVVGAVFAVGAWLTRIPSSAEAHSGTPSSSGTRVPSTPAPSVATSAVVPAMEPFTVVVAGELCFAGRVSKRMARDGGAAPLAAVAPLLSSADVAIAGLEGLPVGTGIRAARSGAVRGAPTCVDALRNAGLDALALADDHALDFGEAGVTTTLSLLSTSGAQPAGAGADGSAAWRPAVVSPRGAPLAFLSFALKPPARGAAASGHAGVASARDEKAVLRAVRGAKASGARVAVALHWGSANAERPDAAQVRLGHALVEAGADIVLGQGPHVLQAVERYRGAVIAYSLGDLVRAPAAGKGAQAVLLSLTLGPDGPADFVVTPVVRDRDGYPAIARGAQAKNVLKRLDSLSRRRSTHVLAQGGTGVVEVAR
jgi:poly-gamma-glutamate synthesis protein (capsule biosynthesis protein)